MGEAVEGFFPALFGGRFSKPVLLPALTKALPPFGGGFNVALNPAEFEGRSTGVSRITTLGTNDGGPLLC